MPPTPGVPPGPPPGSPVWPPSTSAVPYNSAPAAVSGSPWSSAGVAQTQVYPPAAAVPQIVPPAQASWYTRIEYFHWNERISGTNFVNEDGSLFTLGYARQFGIERFRAELFGGDVHYDGYDQTGTAAMASNTGYLGLRGEYEIVLAPAAWQGRVALLAGLGTRFWIRDLHDGSDDQGNQVLGYQETWWTIYPYLGLETHLPTGADMVWYSESRIGTTALTYQFATTGSVVSDGQGDLWFAERPLWPRPGVFANMEIGLRGPQFFIAARAEVMTWAPSSVVQDAYQPNSVMFTVGGRLGFMF